MTPDEHFLATVRDLEQCLASTERYHLNRSFGLIRKLLLDQNGLAVQVNRKRRIKLRFDVVALPRPTVSPNSLFALAFLLAGKEFPNSPARKSITLDQFLGRHAGTILGIDFTIRELVSYANYVLGGVHAGEPKDDIQRHLKDLDAHMYLANGPPTAAFLRAISNVVLDALAPLRKSIEGAQANQHSPTAGSVGLAVQMVVAIHDEANLEGSCLFDIGTVPTHNRVLLRFIPCRGLVLDVWDANGVARSASVPMADGPFELERFFLLTLQVASSSESARLVMEINGRRSSEVQSGGFPLALPPGCPLVMGSDISTRQQSAMSVAAYILCDKPQDSETLARSRASLMSLYGPRFDAVKHKVIRFSNSQFMRSARHPLFATIADRKPSDLVQPDTKRTPKYVDPVQP